MHQNSNTYRQIFELLLFSNLKILQCYKILTVLQYTYRVTVIIVCVLQSYSEVTHMTEINYRTKIK